MTTYTSAVALAVSLCEQDGTPVVLQFESGDITPKDEREAAIFKNLLNAGVVSIATPAAAKPTKSKPADTPAAPETE